MTKDGTAAMRQRKRLERLAAQGVSRKTLLVHDSCRPAYEALKPLFANSTNATLLDDLIQLESLKKPVNVSKVRQLSPFRYPGGKTWLVPEIRSWLASLSYKPKYFIEPFAGGGIASLTVAVEDLADMVLMVELDPDVASVWKTILEEPDYLCSRILNFEVNYDNVVEIIDNEPKMIRERAFRTIVKNRTQRGGILAPGASLVKSGENGKGLRSRWYPETLVKRIRLIHEYRDKIGFIEEDGFQTIRRNLRRTQAAFFIDPPYTVGGKRAGSRLYRYSEVEHDKLFDQMSRVKGQFLMTYNDAAEVRALAKKHGFSLTSVPMKNTHHAVIFELLLTRE